MMDGLWLPDSSPAETPRFRIPLLESGIDKPPAKQVLAATVTGGARVLKCSSRRDRLESDKCVLGTCLSSFSPLGARAASFKSRSGCLLASSSPHVVIHINLPQSR